MGTDPAAPYGHLDAEAVLSALVIHRVDFVVVGGTAAIQYGATRATRDVDCVVATSAENLQRVCDALHEMGNPRIRAENVPDETAIELSKSLVNVDYLQRLELSTWRTDSGSVDILRNLPDANGKLLPIEDIPSLSVTTDAGLVIRLGTLSAIIESKEWSNRPKDLEALPELRQLRDNK